MNTISKLDRLFRYSYFILALLISACSNEIESIDSTKEEISSIEDDIRKIESLGFDVSDITETESYYLVEGDILLEKSKLASYDKPQTRQAYHTTGLIARAKQTTITVGVDNSIPTSGEDNWREQIQAAINLWNPLSNLKMTYTLDPNPDILIRSDVNNPLPDYAIASAFWPMNGMPGSSISINLDYDGNKTIPRLQKTYNMVHELGHCFGLRHTNWVEMGESQANHIDGTPITDSRSVMNGWTAENLWDGFSSGDRAAIDKLYPTFSASMQFPGNLQTWQLGVTQFTIPVSCSYPIVSYGSWSTTGGVFISSQGNTATVIIGSPVTFSLGVYVTTIYGERYHIGRDIGSATTTWSLIGYL